MVRHIRSMRLSTDANRASIRVVLASIFAMRTRNSAAVVLIDATAQMAAAAMATIVSTVGASNCTSSCPLDTRCHKPGPDNSSSDSAELVQSVATFGTDRTSMPISL